MRKLLFSVSILIPTNALAFDICWGNVIMKEGPGIYTCRAQGAPSIKFDSRQDACIWGSARELQVVDINGRKIRIPAGDKYPYYECHKEVVKEVEGSDAG